MSFPRIAFCAGVVTALSVLCQLTEGAVPCPKRFYFQSCPAVTPAGKLPSSREGDRNFLRRPPPAVRFTTL